MPELQIEQVPAILIKTMQSRRPELYRALLAVGQLQPVIEQLTSLVAETMDDEWDRSRTNAIVQGMPGFQADPMARMAQLKMADTAMSRIALEQAVAEIDAMQLPQH